MEEQACPGFPSSSASHACTHWVTQPATPVAAAVHAARVQRLPDRLGLKPYVVHGTFQFSGTPGKRHRMREALLWNVSTGLMG